VIVVVSSIFTQYLGILWRDFHKYKSCDNRAKNPINKKMHVSKGKQSRRRINLKLKKQTNKPIKPRKYNKSK